ncbi:MAG: T9SS type A sorting domain-containing protein [Bacteroidota bacterium]
MKKSWLLGILVSFTLNSNAQKWVDMMTDSTANFYDIVAEFDNYWKDRPYERGKGYKAFKRWQWFMEPRVYPSGNMKLATRGLAYQNYIAEIGVNQIGKTNNNSSAVVSATTANWTPLGPFGSPTGGDAGRIQCVRVVPTNTNLIYAGAAAGGFWMSNNGGVSYTTTTDYFASCGVSDIAIHPSSTNTLFISTGDKDAGDTHSTGVFKSTDGGLTWAVTGLTWTPSQQRRIYRLLINPSNPDIMIAATSVGMYYTSDGAVTWSITGSGSFVDAEYKPGDPNTVYAATAAGVRVSTNGGLTYTNTIFNPATAANRLSLAVTPANPNVLYVLASRSSDNGFGGLYRSVNSASSFTTMSTSPNIFDWSTNGSGSGGQGWYDIAIDASPTNSNEIIVGGVNTWKSTNGGSTWVLNTHWYGGGGKPYVHADLHSVKYLSGTVCYLGTDGGIARTTNSGATWTTINGNMNIAQIYELGLSASSASRIVTGHQDNGTNLLNGTSWSQIYGGDGAACFIDWGNNNTIIASYIYGDFQRSTNGGSSWTNIVSGLPAQTSANAPWIAPIVQHPTQQNTYYCGYKQIYRSTNQGSSWTQLGNIGTNIDRIKIAPSNTNVIYVTSNSGVYKTINGGTTWSNVVGSIPVSSGNISDVTVSNLNENTVFVTLSGYSSGNKVFRSIDGGATWSNYSSGIPNLPVQSIVHTNNSNDALYVGTDNGVFYRDGSMLSWMPYNQGLPNIEVSDLEIYYPTGKLRAATYSRGVWETNLYSNPTAVPVAAFNTAFSSGCVGTPLQFNDMSGNTPNSWSWTFSGGTPSVSTNQNPSVTFPSTGIYTVSLISTNVNGPSTPYTTTVSVVSPATISPINASVCAGFNANIGVTTNGSLVQWQTGQLGTNIAVLTPTNASYNFTVYNGACVTTGSSSVTINAMPSTPTIVLVGNALTTTVIASGYQWYLNGSPIPGETASTLTPTVDGFYSVWVNNGGCVSSSSSFEYIAASVVQNSGNFINSQVSPIPSKDKLQIKLDKNYQNINYSITAVNGQTIKMGTLKLIGNTAQLNIEDLASGVYFLKINSENKTGIYKVIKS